MMRMRSISSIYNQLIAGFKFIGLRLQNNPVHNLFTILVCLLILFSLPSSIFAETFVSGNITQNTTWTLAGSPYIVTADVTVRYSSKNSSTAVLTIEPGVEIKFEPGTRLYIGYYIYHAYFPQHFYGALSAQGTAQAPIVFTSNATAPAAGDWKGIYFRNETNDGLTILDNCVVEYGDNSLTFKQSNPTITNSTIRYSSRHGISLSASAAVIEGNRITDNYQDGIYSDNGSSALISNNTFSGNGTAAINVHPDKLRRITGNSGSEYGSNHIKVRGGEITSNGTWANQGFAYVIVGDVTVRYHSENSDTAVLTIEPGVEIRFEPGTGLYIGYYIHHYYFPKHFYGALSAQGTAQAPITFTSNATAPAPGDWKGIYFRDQTNNTATLLEHCIVEYGGNTNSANINLNNAKPTIQYNTIRNSSHSGIYISGTGANGALVSCNNLKDNVYGVYTAGSTQPLVNNNNFLRNQHYGVYNSGSLVLDGKDNWWGDADGPGFNGDDVYGSVDYAPWLAAASNCIDTPPTNSPPFEPKSPFPTNTAVRVPVLAEGQPVTVALNWTGGDPNPWDTVVYDVYFGTSPGSLTQIADSIALAVFDKTDLAEGSTCYWQIIARDDVGTETAGPVWSFTTLGPPPDLVISQIEWNPMDNLAAGREIVFTATLENIGSGPVVDPFQMAFKIDGAGIGAKTVPPVIPAGGTVQVAYTWTARTGDFSIEVLADSAGTVIESFEENNTLAAGLPNIIDPTAPELVGTVPNHDATLNALSRMEFSLFDQFGSVDDGAVIASVAVTDGSSQLVGCSVSEVNDLFTITPDNLPLIDDTYLVSLAAIDLAGNAQSYSFSFTIDKQDPAEPVITGGTLTSGVIQLRPIQNSSNSTTVTLTGTREDHTSVWINNQLKVNSGSDNWSVDMTLTQGNNSLEIRAEDPAGNRSPSVWVDIQVDSIAPSITAVAPANNSFANTPPGTMVIDYQEAGSGLNLDNSTRSIQDGSQLEVAGTWADSAGSQLVFTPAAALTESYYTMALQLVDSLGNRGAAAQFHFTVDTTPPPAPEVLPVTSPAHNPNQAVTGTKEAYAAILVDGQQALGQTASTDWQHTLNLTSGSNQFTFVARDRAGNHSPAVNVDIIFDDIPPPPVNTLTLNGQGDGTTVYLNWNGYDEAGHGDVAFYRIYFETAGFSDVSGLTPHSTTPAGHFSATVQNLSRSTTYWFAVIAVDAMGNAQTTVNPVSGAPLDLVPPENVTNLQAQAYADRLVFTWNHSTDAAGDLAGYRVIFGADNTGQVIAATQNTYEQIGLAAATGYLFKVISIDNDTNASSAAAVTGVTLLPNPGNPTADPQSGYVDLTWKETTPSQYVKHYAVYKSENDFSTVEGMSPLLTTTTTAAKVAGLTNGQTYYFAVTTKNTSDGEDKVVSTVSATPQQDASGPEISDVKIDGAVLVSGHALNTPATFTAVATDPAGISRLEFAIDAAPIRVDYNPVYSCFWNVVPIADGNYTLTVTAYDTLGNSSTIDFALVVALAPPAAPVITQPASGILTNLQTMMISGHGEKYTEVMIYNDATEACNWVAVDALGNFSTSVTLAEGPNRLQAAARNRTGVGPLGSEVLVSLDTSLPLSPANLTAQAKQGGVVGLIWQPPSDTSVSGYNLYRSHSPFSDPGAGTKINANLITTPVFEDLPPAAGTWYYRATTIDTAANESELSNEALAASDSTAPRAVSIDYTPRGSYDPVSGRMAPATVGVMLTVNEALQATPYLSIVPQGGIPLPVALIKATDLTYTGFFVISTTTPDGTAYAIFSGRDSVGNRGTEIDTGASIRIDTAGPVIRRLAINPSSPIQNNEQTPTSVMAIIGLNEQLRPGTRPQLAYLLSGEGRQTVDIDQWSEITPQAGDVQTWQAQFTLPADAGLSAAETFHFIYQGFDDLDNLSNRIVDDNLFQVYQGQLPPLEPPQGLSALALPEGKIRLTWMAVNEAVGYQLYRKAPGESELTEYQRLDRVVAYTDPTAVDGTYTYTVASIRRENDQETVSGQSAEVTVASDSVAPGAPHNLALELVANGIKAEWSPPPFTEAVTYSLYRATAAEIASVEGLTPLAVGIPQTLVVDPRPSPAAHCYAITAVDAVGNQSPPSNSFYLNFQLLPVSGITVVQKDDDPPRVTWTHPGGDIAGYDIYLGADDETVKLNPMLLTQRLFIDTGYTRDERRYTIISKDSSGLESLARSISLPQLAAAAVEGSRIKRGIMNRLDYVVLNEGSGRVADIRLKVKVDSHDHTSDKFSLDPGTSRTIPVVVGGYDDLEGMAALTTTIEATPQANETVQIVRSGDIEVGDGMLVLQILNEEFTRAASGRVRFTLENTGEAEIEIMTARNSGTSPSDQITFYLVDEDDNILTSKAFQQAVGDKIVTLSNRNSVARIGAGETFTSDFITMAVPANAPDDATIRLEISNVYYHQGQTTQVSMTGLASNHQLSMVDTTYYGEVADITPQTSTGGQDIVISGQAVARVSGDPTANVPLNLVITLNGFERSSSVYTGEGGIFNYTFKPLAGESGVYKVRAVHPDRTDKPVHGQFVINRVSVTPSAVNLNVPRNYSKTVSIRVGTGEGTAVNNLRLEYNREDQPTGEYPQGVHLSAGAAKAYLGSKKTAWLPFTLWADNSAGASGKLVLKVKSDESDPGAWGNVTVNTQFSDSSPVLYFTPNHVETGMARDKTVTETVALGNKGLAPLNDVTLSLHNPDGSPAPGWVYLTSAADQGAIAVGEWRNVGIAFSPTLAVTEGNYAFGLRVSASNYAAATINLYVAVTQKGLGNVLFKVSDIYTGTINPNGDVIQGLSGARVNLQNEVVRTEEYTGYTDSFGEAWFEAIPSGQYKCRISAKNHQDYLGRIWIKPGVSINEDIFLDYNLVTVEWEVNEIGIEDKYEIVLSATYETDVPAAVVAVKPSSISLPAMQAGDVFNGEFTLTNYGLIRADDLKVNLPPDDQYFAYELMGGLPESLSAKEKITVPYRVTCIKSLDQQDDGQATGGGCHNYRTCAVVDYGYVCANGQSTKAAINHCWTRTYGECTSGGGGSITASAGGGTWNVGGGTAGGTISKPAPKPKTIQGVKCFPKPERKENFCLPCYLKGAWSNFFQKVFSSVNLVMREYVREEPDLFVKVPGGIIEAKRWYFGNSWRWEHFRHNLKFNLGSLGSSIETVEKDEVLYKATSTDSNIFSHEFYRIIKTEEGWRWEHKNGDWKLYDAAGNMTAYGTRTGTVGKLIYENGEMAGIADRNDNQVLWYEYDGNQISAVSDIKNRRVAYGYTNGRLSSATNVTGGTTRFEYDTKGRIDKIIDAENFNSIVVYDSYGHVASVVDSNGEGHFFEYDYDEGAKEAYVRIRSSAGKIREIWFDRNSEPIRVDVNGRTVQKIVRDGRDLIITDENSRITRKEYDEWDNLTRIIYPDSTTAHFEYEHNFNQKIKETNEQSVITEFNYDEAGNLIRKTEAVDTEDERVTEYAYGGDGNLLTTRRLADGDSSEALTAMTYDEVGNLSSTTDPQGGITRFTSHDIMGNMLTKIDARGKEWKYEYDSAGRLTSVTDPIVNDTEPHRNVTRIFYDQVGNKVREVDPVGKETLYAYDAHKNLIQVTDGQGNFSRFEYDEDGKPVRQVDPEGKFIRYEYDSDGRLLKTIDGNGNEIAMDYGDAAGTGCSSCSGEKGAADQPSRIKYPTFEKHFSYDQRGRKLLETDVFTETESYVSMFGYDDSGNLVARTDPEQNTTAYGYDYLNRLIRITDAALKDTIYTYDNRDNLIALTDAESNTTRFEYDLSNRLQREIRPGGQQTSYQYDAAGNLTKKIDAKDQKTEYNYDDAGRLVEIRYFESSDNVNPIKTVTLTYDRVGNLTGYNDGITSATYIYDDLYRKLSETLNYGSFELGHNYTYYRNGLKQTFTNPDGLTYEYTYDDNNQLVGVQIPEVGYITHSAYKWNRPEEVLFPGGSRRQYDYDPLMRVKSITAEDPGRNILMQYQYDYDKVSNIIEKSTGHGNYAYAYDALYRLRNADNPGQSDEAFTYDAVGNRLTSSDTIGNWSYNQNNELQNHDDVSYVYDANGNMTQKSVASVVTNYIYNVENRLERVEDGSGSLIATYYYDPFGRRLWKEVGGVKTYFFYADEGLIGEYDQYGAEIKTYGYKPGSIWTTDPLFMKIGADYYFYQNDHLGTPQKMTAMSGAVVWGAKYTSFGEATIDPLSTVINNLRFPGQYYDEGTELIYNWHRYYAPNTGKYLRSDPIGFLGGDPNLSSYVFNNPINGTDPLGLQNYNVANAYHLLHHGYRPQQKRIPREKIKESILIWAKSLLYLDKTEEKCDAARDLYDENPNAIDPFTPSGALSTFAVGMSEHISKVSWEEGGTPNSPFFFIETMIAGGARVINAQNNFGSGRVVIDPPQYNGNNLGIIIYEVIP